MAGLGHFCGSENLLAGAGSKLPSGIPQKTPEGPPRAFKSRNYGTGAK